jgi:hypothetical protein
MKIILAIILVIIGLFVFRHGTGSLKAAQHMTGKFMLMLQEFAKNDIVGII